jgi:hypothetical protein
MEGSGRHLLRATKSGGQLPEQLTAAFALIA